MYILFQSRPFYHELNPEIIHWMVNVSNEIQYQYWTYLHACQPLFCLFFYAEIWNPPFYQAVVTIYRTQRKNKLSCMVKVNFDSYHLWNSGQTRRSDTHLKSVTENTTWYWNERKLQHCCLAVLLFYQCYQPAVQIVFMYIRIDNAIIILSI